MKRPIEVVLAALLIASGLARGDGPSHPAPSERNALIYEFYELGGPDGRKLIAKGTKEYTTKDIVVSEEGERRGVHFADMELPIAKGFAAGASIYREKELTGFGMWLKDREGVVGKLGRGGFSWDWFIRESGDVYRKLQGGGRVRVLLAPSKDYQEIQAIEVIEDITLRLKDQSVWVPPIGGDTHNLVLRKGSLLRFYNSIP